MRDLLNHASGFDDEWSLLLLMTADMRSQVETEQVLTLLYNQPKPQVEPGKGYMYNNTDFALLRLIMEAVSRQSLTDYLKVKLFDPLEMKSTLMNDDIEQIIPGLAESYYNYPFRKARFVKFSPGGNYRMVTTADDLEKWARASENPSSIVGKAFARLYRNARPIPTYPDEKQYVFGHTTRMINGTEFIYHGGVGDSFYIVRILSKKISVIGLGNGSNFIRPSMQLAQSFTASKPDKNKSIFFPSEAITLRKDEMAAYAGRYYDQRVGYNSHIPSIRYFDLKIVGDSLRFYPDSDGASFTISAFGNDYFKDNEEGAKIQFIKSHDGSPMKMKVWMDEGSNAHFYLRKEDTVVADKKYLDQFTGQYYSPHLDYYLRIVMNKDVQLVIKRPTMPESVIEPYGKDSLKVEQKNGSYSVYMIASFTKDSAGNIDGFTLRDSRIMHHRFEKVK